ncbi:MAG: RidA family protein [Candidatus Adiutrix sp.]|jgi:2-iminobutanoate/2-iminopropanoate deaminase|nr:RidA family protein [Candidatus Adiutrix sp.]
MKQSVKTDKAPAAIGPYSQAIKTASAVFVSGQLPIDPATGKMPDSTTEQARQSLTNVKAILEAAGSSLDKVVRVGIFMTDLADFKPVNEVYGSFFAGDCPARATVQVAALPLGAKIEIEATAEI